MDISRLPTPCPVIDLSVMRSNIAAMAAVHPGRALRPHVKAHKCSAIAAEQVVAGHTTFTCATPREILGLVAAGVGDDILLANETVDPARLAALADAQSSALITVAVDSLETIQAASSAGIRNVLIDVNVGLPRCGCSPEQAGSLADAARSLGLIVRGVMGYEGHLMMLTDRQKKQDKVHEAMTLLAYAHNDVGGDIMSAGGTGTYDMFAGTAVNEVQAGSYALMDSHYAQLQHPFAQSLWILGTVISVNASWVVIDVGLKSLGMDHGNPTVDGYSVWFCSDEHTTIAPTEGTEKPKVGDRIRVTPAHVDPTMAMHSHAYIINDDSVIDEWAIDLRGW
ncbi:MAG: metal-activated pyridoxal enzyme [Ilumatobacteraceae bacterium]|nr:metal-activated pyridoxal enzyme [Ilumatobacteraceae bacterium]